MRKRKWDKKSKEISTIENSNMNFQRKKRIELQFLAIAVHRWSSKHKKEYLYILPHSTLTARK